MQLKYTLKRRDLLFGRMSLIVRNKVLLVFSILVIGFLTWTISSGPAFDKASLPMRITCGIFAFIFSFFVYFGFQFLVHSIMIMSGKHVGVLGLHTLEIKEEGLQESTTVNQSLNRWNPSFKIKKFGGYVWILPSDGKFFQIPKRTGGHEGDLAGFLALLKIRLAAAKNFKG